MTRDELIRQHRVGDMMVTMYSVLRDRYAWRARALALCIFGSSVILCTAAFLPDDALASLGVSAKATKVIIGFSSSLILFLSIADLCVDWGSLSGRYGEAADRLAKAKGRFREVLNKEAPIAPEEGAKLSAEYNQALDGLPRIPDRQFAKLKAYHHRKVRLSQMIEKFVGCPVWVLRWRLLREGLRCEQDKAKGSDS